MVRVEDCGELLVDIKHVCPWIVVDYADKARQKKEPAAYLREGVAVRLTQAVRSLPQEITFVINDAWRPKELQKRYFDQYCQKFRREHPKWEESKILEMAGQFAVGPNDEGRAGHLTGAAIDLELWNINAGRRLPQNSRRLSFAEGARLDQAKLTKHILLNRQMLAEAMSGAGFVNYPREYWHWSYGDVMWAEQTGEKVAVYGVVNDRISL